MGPRRRWQRGTTLLGALPLGVGAGVLLGWYLDYVPLIRLSPDLPVMQAATAVAFLFSGLAILAAERRHAGAAAILGATVAVIGGLSVTGFFVDLPSDIHVLPFVPDVGGGAIRPQSMAPKSGLAFALAGVAAVLLAAGRRRSSLAPLMAGVAAAAIVLLAGEDLLKYTAEVSGATGRTLKQMALHTALTFLALAAALASLARARLEGEPVRGIRRAWAAAVFVIFVSGLAAHGMRTSQVASIDRMAGLAAREAAARLSEGIESRRQAIAALAARSDTLETDSAQWTAFASALAGHVSGIREVAWVDGAGILRWSSPAGAALPVDPVIAVPRTAGGGTIIAGLDMPALLEAVVPGSDAFALEIVAGSFRFRRDAVDAEGDPVFTHEIPLALPGGVPGTLVIRPARALLNDARRPLPLATLILGILFAGMLAAAVWLGVTAQGRAARLQRALEAVEAAVRERRRAEAALARSEARLRESRKMEAVARLAGGVAHHFNNLLSVVRGHADLLLDAGAQPDARGESLGEIRAAAERGGELTRNLLTMSARHVLHPRTVDLFGLVSGQARGLGRLLDDRIQLRVRTETTDTRVHIDPAPFTNALDTLAANARDAMPEGGSLALTLRERALHRAEATVLGVRPGAYVELEVADTGAGIDEVRRETLFEPFAGASAGGRTGGFGLAMLYGFVNQSGGAVEVESEPGRGSAFRILLPRADGRAAVRTCPAPAPAVSDAPVILLAEDEDAVRHLAVRILERAGYQTISAADGLDALALVKGREGAIDLVLTDVVMPGVDGRELARRLWAERPGLPVLFVSGYTADDLPAAGSVDARVAFLQKPFDAASLVDGVRDLLSAEQVAGD